MYFLSRCVGYSSCTFKWEWETAQEKSTGVEMRGWRAKKRDCMESVCPQCTVAMRMELSREMRRLRGLPSLRMEKIRRLNESVDPCSYLCYPSLFYSLFSICLRRKNLIFRFRKIWGNWLFLSTCLVIAMYTSWQGWLVLGMAKSKYDIHGLNFYKQAVV